METIRNPEDMEMLNKLAFKNIFSVELTSDKAGLFIIENCDMWYSTVLTKKEVSQLIKELNELKKAMI